jgi:hypothetical protein
MTAEEEVPMNVIAPGVRPSSLTLPSPIRSPFAPAASGLDTFSPGAAPAPSLIARAEPRRGPGTAIAGAAIALASALVLVGTVGVILSIDGGGPGTSISESVSPARKAYDDLSYLDRVGHEQGGGLQRPILGPLGTSIAPGQAVDRLEHGQRVLYRESGQSRPYAIDTFSEAGAVRGEVSDHRAAVAVDRGLQSVQEGLDQAASAARQGLQNLRDAVLGPPSR